MGISIHMGDFYESIGLCCLRVLFSVSFILSNSAHSGTIKSDLHLLLAIIQVSTVEVSIESNRELIFYFEFRQLKKNNSKNE